VAKNQVSFHGSDGKSWGGLGPTGYPLLLCRVRLAIACIVLKPSGACLCLALLRSSMACCGVLPSWQGDSGDLLSPIWHGAVAAAQHSICLQPQSQHLLYYVPAEQVHMKTGANCPGPVLACHHSHFAQALLFVTCRLQTDVTLPAA
jgi:hypothetical protein